MWNTIVLLAVFVSGYPLYGPNETGTISGIVTDDHGAPVSNATVYYNTQGVSGGVVPAAHPLHSAQVLTFLIRSFVTTEADGNFSIVKLAPGSYKLCVAGVAATQLMTCQWTRQSSQVTITPGAVQRVKFTLFNGTLLKFVVEDPNHRIVDLADLNPASDRIPINGANFGIGVFVGTRYAKATLVSTASNGTREYQLAVPRQSSPRLFLATSLNVTDLSGNVIPEGVPGNVMAVNSEPSVSVNLMIP